MSARGASKKRAPVGVRIVLLLACLVLLLAWLRHAGRWPFAGAPRTDALGPAWRAGHVYDYDVHWTGKSIARTNAAGAEGVPELIEGSLALDGAVRIEALPSRGAVFPVRVALQSVDRASMVVLGQDVLSDDKLRESVLNPRTLEAEMDGAGHLVRMRLPTDTPELAAQLIEGILLELQATRARGEVYTVEERTPEGVFRVRYERAADMLRRKRTDVVSLNASASCDATCETTLEGGSRLRFDLEGDLAEVHDDEHTVAAEHGGAPVFQSTLRFDAALRSVTKAGAPSLLAASAGFAFKMAGDPWESAETANQLLEKRAAGITLDDVLSGLRLAGGIGPEHLPDGWIVRTAAFFELHPELLNELSVRFDDPAATQQSRVTILDLLAATGTAPAQKMLRDLIGGRTTNGDANRLALVQRVTLLENPAPETVRFMRDRFDVSRASGDLHMELASAHALGSLAGRSSSETREDSRAAVTALDEAMHDSMRSATWATATTCMPSQPMRKTKTKTCAWPSPRPCARRPPKRRRAPFSRSPPTRPRASSAQRSIRSDSSRSATRCAARSVSSSRTARFHPTPNHRR